MNETQFCERADAVAHRLDDDDMGSRYLAAGGSGCLADPDHVFYLSAEQAPPRRAGSDRSREILGW